MNQCKECIRKEDRSEATECPVCKEISLMSRLEGASMLIHCSTCGYAVAGASFFAPCEVDMERYTLTVAHAEKRNYVKLAALFGINVVQLRDSLIQKGFCSKTGGLEETIKDMNTLDNMGEKYTVTPDLMAKYPEFDGCIFRD